MVRFINTGIQVFYIGNNQVEDISIPIDNDVFVEGDEIDMRKNYLDL